MSFLEVRLRYVDALELIVLFIGPELQYCNGVLPFQVAEKRCLVIEFPVYSPFGKVGLSSEGTDTHLPSML